MEEWEQQTLLHLLGFLHDYYLVQRADSFSGNTLGQLFGPMILRGCEGPLPIPFPEDIRAAAEVVDSMIYAFPVVFRLPSPCSSPYHKPPSRCLFLPPFLVICQCSGEQHCNEGPLAYGACDRIALSWLWPRLMSTKDWGVNQENYTY